MVASDDIGAEVATLLTWADVVRVSRHRTGFDGKRGMKWPDNWVKSSNST